MGGLGREIAACGWDVLRFAPAGKRARRKGEACNRREKKKRFFENNLRNGVDFTAVFV